MDHPIFTTSVLVVGLALAVVAQWRGWRPSLRVSLAVGIAFRLILLVSAAGDSWQPVDFNESFRPAGAAILAGQDPVLASNGGWHFLPMVPYMYALPLALGIPWEIAGRLWTILADLVLIFLVGKLARGHSDDGGIDRARGREALARFQYACNPIALIIAVIHAQVEPISLVFLVGAYLVALPRGGAMRDGHRARRAIVAGLLFGLALSAKSWPIVLLPVMLAMLPTWRHRLYGLVAAGAVPLFFFVTLPLFVNTSVDNLKHAAQYMGGVRPIVGEWGWTALLTGGNWELVPAYSRYGQLLLYSTLLVVALLWWRANRIDQTSAMLLAFMIVTPRMGAQYLLWFVPFLVARPTRWSQPAIGVAAVWAGIGYIYLTQFDETQWWINHRWWAQTSVVVIVFLAAAIPWTRRRAEPPAAAPEETPRELVGSQ
ncbi:MAG TPA: glycosyltransferase 87 family protein [Streptosporangiaceae bacterium]|jgi:hypothetical protein